MHGHDNGLVKFDEWAQTGHKSRNLMEGQEGVCRHTSDALHNHSPHLLFLFDFLRVFHKIKVPDDKNRNLIVGEKGTLKFCFLCAIKLH